MSYEVKLQQFEGPLDLLLHLISKSKVQIEDISITEITEQYLETLRIMEEFDMEIASEFLVMAATLLHIKSCILVPKAKPDLEEQDEDDPGKDLITRLLEYKKYKEASSKLKEREAYFSSMFYKLPEEMYFEEIKEVLPPDLSIDALQDALRQLLMVHDRKVKESKSPLIHEIKRDPVTIHEKVDFLKAFLGKQNQTTFFSIFLEDHTRADIIATFLALLELLKDSWLDIEQDYPYGDIVIKRRIVNG